MSRFTHVWEAKLQSSDLLDENFASWVTSWVPHQGLFWLFGFYRLSTNLSCRYWKKISNESIENKLYESFYVSLAPTMIFWYLIIHFENQKDGSVFKRDCYPSRGCRHSSYLPHGSLQPPVTSVWGVLISSSRLCGYLIHMVQLHIYRENTHPCKIKNKIKPVKIIFTERKLRRWLQNCFETLILIYPYLKGIIYFLSILIISDLHIGIAHILFPSLLPQMKDRSYSMS